VNRNPPASGWGISKKKKRLKPWRKLFFYGTSRARDGNLKEGGKVTYLWYRDCPVKAKRKKEGKTAKHLYVINLGYKKSNKWDNSPRLIREEAY